MIRPLNFLTAKAKEPDHLLLISIKIPSNREAAGKLPPSIVMAPAGLLAYPVPTPLALTAALLPLGQKRGEAIERLDGSFQVLVLMQA